MKFEIIIYFLGLLMGITITSFAVHDYLEQQEIKKEGVKVEVTMLKSKHTRKGSVPQIQYQNKVYDWYGGKGTKGRTYTAIYSPSKDKFLNGYDKHNYFPVFLGVFFIGVCIYGLVKEVFFSSKENRT